MKEKIRTFGLFVVILLAMAACKSAPPVIPEDLSPPEYFQRAQEEADKYEWDNALVYYRTFLERYPDDFVNGLFARYEVAFVLYKKQEYQESKKLFQELLDSYKKIPNPLSVPQWPKVLSEKLVQKIDQKLEALLPTKNEPKIPEQQPLPPQVQEGIRK